MIFCVKGINVKIGFTFFAVLTILLCFNINPVVLVSVISAVLHEAGHLLCLLVSGDKPQKIEFGLFGLSVVRSNDIKLNYKTEIISAFFGPLVNIIIAGICLLAYSFLKTELLLTVISVNLFLSFFNLMPVFGLDGGRILEFFLLSKYPAERTEKIMRYASALTIVPIMSTGFFILIKSGYNFSLIMLSCYLSFLLYKRVK